MVSISNADRAHMGCCLDSQESLHLFLKE